MAAGIIGRLLLCLGPSGCWCNWLSVVVFRSKRLLVPANTISRVIGRGGCNINAIRDISTAQVEIDRSRDATTERIITIK